MEGIIIGSVSAGRRPDLGMARLPVFRSDLTGKGLQQGLGPQGNQEGHRGRMTSFSVLISISFPLAPPTRLPSETNHRLPQLLIPLEEKDSFHEHFL